MLTRLSRISLLVLDDWLMAKLYADAILDRLLHNAYRIDCATLAISDE